MLRPQGYATISGPDHPHVVEFDTISCGHCQRIVHVKPGTGSTIYVFRQVNGNVREEMGAFCRQCMKPVCLSCHDHGRCVPFEARLEQMEARGRLIEQVTGSRS